MQTFQHFLPLHFLSRERKRDSDQYDIYDGTSVNPESRCCGKTVRINRMDILITCLLGLIIIVLSVILGIFLGTEFNKGEFRLVINLCYLGYTQNIYFDFFNIKMYSVRATLSHVTMEVFVLMTMV